MSKAAIHSLLCPHTARGGVSSRSRHTELLLNCARIGYNP